MTQQALQLAQQINTADVAYRWQWQLGRVLKAQGKNEGAIAVYKEAVSTIKSLRADLAVASPDVQFSFRDAVEPIHRQLVGLLVQSNQQKDLKAARDAIESLQLVELDNFFREACLNANPEQVDRVDQRAGVIYAIILEDQLAIIVSLPEAASKLQQQGERDLRYYTTAVSGQKFLVEQYSIALTPGLQLLAPRSLKQERLGMLVAGLNATRPPAFSALPYVETEVQKIKSEVSNQVLFNEKFTNSALLEAVAVTPYPIVHLATHDQFSSQADETFILTWDDKIKVNQLSSML